MLLNRDHRSSALASCVVTAVAALFYWLYAASSAYGPSGGSWPGLAFGIAGTALMTFEGLLAWRKRHRTARIGAAQLWMKLHIWLGFMAVPLILFHAGFSLGGPLTTTLMVLFAVVTASGIFGLVVQQIIPRLMTHSLPTETIHSQFVQVRNGLAADAYEVVASVAGDIAEAAPERAWLQRPAQARWKAVPRQRAASEPLPGSAALKTFYASEVRPYLLAERGGRRALPDVRAILVEAPVELHPKLERLRAICEERRQLDVQARLHAWLHNWLFVHAPLSFALFVLIAFHIYYALQY
jgi:hypothetical protein